MILFNFIYGSVSEFYSMVLLQFVLMVLFQLIYGSVAVFPVIRFNPSVVLSQYSLLVSFSNHIFLNLRPCFITPYSFVRLLYGHAQCACAPVSVCAMGLLARQACLHTVLNR